MSTEQLKMILDAMRSLGEGGSEAFIWWLLADKVFPYMAGASIVAMGAYTVLRIVRHLNPTPGSNHQPLPRLAAAREAVRQLWLYDDGATKEQTEATYNLYQAAEAIAKTRGLKE